jgi:hypothetical protein
MTSAEVSARPRRLGSVRSPALHLWVQRDDVEHQEDAGERDVIEQVAQVDDAALDALEAAACAERAQDFAQLRGRRSP